MKIGVKCLTRVVLGVITLGRLESNYAMERKMERFIGHSEADVAMVMGTPTSRISDPTCGDIVLVYSRVTSFTTPGVSTSSGSASFTGRGFSSVFTSIFIPPAQSTEYKILSFRLNGKGIVYDYHWTISVE